VLALGSLAVSHGWIATPASRSPVTAAQSSAPKKSTRASRGGMSPGRPAAAATPAPSAEVPPVPAPPIESPPRVPAVTATGQHRPAPAAHARSKAAAADAVAVGSRVERASAADGDSASSSDVAVAQAAGGGPSPAADEIGLVRDALERLRGRKDAAGALRRLDEYDQRFPSGLLGEESRTIRIEALLALGRKIEALTRLDALPAATLDRSPRLRVARGELRVAAGRCPDALGDFAAVVAAGAGGDIQQRADRGRAACNFGGPRHTGATGGDR
jgi:hypothetical protein